ncbi:MAG: DUF1292 domain-containing protein [Lachnospiraceae bacterium]|nr:DUF1292 domain-containing protein [Lachnospiraceae bacterium]
MGQNEDKSFDFNGRDTIVLELDDLGTVECLVISQFSCYERNYIALLPFNEEGGVDEDAEIWLYRFESENDEEVVLDNIPDDEEYEKVSDYFDEMLDTDEFNSLFEEDDELPE